MKSWTIRGPRRFVGELTPPPDKSITHRALLLSAIAEGVSHIRNPLRGEDCMATVRAISQLGAGVEADGSDFVVTGVGEAGLKQPDDILYVGNAGTLIRLLAGLVASYPIDTILTGDESICRRPMDRIIEPLRMMGAQIEGAQGDTRAPLRISGRALHPLTYSLAIPSAQVKSALLLAGLRSKGAINLMEREVTRDHTERMLRDFGVNITWTPVPQDPDAPIDRIRDVGLVGPVLLKATDVRIPGDISSAAFFIAGALVAPGSELRLRRVGWNPTRLGMLDLLAGTRGVRPEGVDDSKSERTVDTLTVTPGDFSAPMRVSRHGTARMIDEVPVFALANAAAGREVVLDGIGELRHKESDRVASTIRLLEAFGAKAHVEKESKLIVEGGATFRAGRLDSGGDHRIAMAGAIAACLVAGESEITDVACVDTSYPSFREDLESVTELI